jgi:hypothetical protein
MIRSGSELLLGLFKYLKDSTQPSQTCSEGYISLLLYATVVLLCIWGVVTRLD